MPYISSHPASHLTLNPTPQITPHGSLSKESELHRFPQQHLPPPDSPEAVRREFATDHSKRDLPKNDRTRLYLQERINRERDRFHGKRSLSFTDEYEEYKNNTIRAAKRALLGPNPFNIGVQLPDDFLLRTDKRMCQTERVIPADVKRYFINSQLGDGITNNPSLDSYITVRDLENRRTVLNTDIKLESNDHREAQVQTIRIGMKNMNTHSPIPVNCEEKNKFSTEGISNSNGNTRSPLHICNQSMCFQFNPPISCSQTSKSPNRGNNAACPNLQLPVNLPRIPTQGFVPIDPSRIITAQRALAIQPNPQVKSPNPSRNYQINPDQIGIYSEYRVPDVPCSYKTDNFRQIDKSSLETSRQLGTVCIYSFCLFVCLFF